MSGGRVRLVSGVSGEGVRAILREAYRQVRRRKAEAEGAVFDEEDDDITEDAEGWAP